jgi:ribA/ribD-fused uncharacterized protein
MTPINSFQEPHRFLSNFWPCYIEWEGLVYPTLEHAYVSAKVEAHVLKEKIRSCSTPGEAKEYLAANQLETAGFWTNEKKLQVMEDLLHIKFGGKVPLLTRALLGTGYAELIEGNTWDDTFWGVCNGTGENHLGKLLMKVRAKLLEEKNKIEALIPTTQTHRQLADACKITPLQLYEKMLSFNISQKKYLGY